MSTLLNFNSEISKEANKFDSLPEDRYVVKAEESVAAPTQKGGEMIKVTFVVTEGKYKGRKLWHQFSIGGKSNTFVFNFLKTIGSDIITKDDVTTVDVANAIKGCTVSAFVEPSVTQNGNPTNKLSKFQAVDGATAAASTSTSAPATKKPLFS